MRGRGTNGRAAWIAVGCALAAALALGLSACGGGSGQANAEAKDATTAGSETQPAAQPEKHPAPAAETCAAQVGGVIDSMATLRRDLVARVSYADYVPAAESHPGAGHRVPVRKP